MKIEKEVFSNDFNHYYEDSKTGNWINHGLWYNSVNCIGYEYHAVMKGFWLMKWLYED